MIIAGVHDIVPLTTPLLKMLHVGLAYWMEKFVLVHKKDGSD